MSKPRLLTPEEIALVETCCQADDTMYFPGEPGEFSTRDLVFTLRAARNELTRVRKQRSELDDKYLATYAERDAAIQRAEQAEAEVVRLRAVETAAMEIKRQTLAPDNPFSRRQAWQRFWAALAAVQPKASVLAGEKGG